MFSSNEDHYSETYGHGNGPQDKLYAITNMYIRAIVAIPLEVTPPLAGAGFDFTTAAVVIWQTAMNKAPQMRTCRLPTLSERNKTKKPQATTLIAPKMAVSNKSLSPPPTRSLKYCGPKYANACGD
jgi:hypothetical protein